MTELLLDTPLDATQRGYVGAIRTAGDTCCACSTMRWTSHASIGALELAEEAFDLHRMLADVAALVAPPVRARGLDFRLDIADDVPRGVVG